MEERYATVQERVERVLDRHVGERDRPTQQEIDDLYTDACATVLLLEGELTSVERRLAAAADAGAEDAVTIRRSRDLARRRAQIGANLVALRVLVDRLHTAAAERRFAA